MIISMYKTFSGIDEAALGPILGPFCCGLVAFNINNDVELFDLFSLFKNVKICDSKKLYTSGKSIRELENTALTFYSCLFKSQPKTLFEFLSKLLIHKKTLDELSAIPWFNSMKSLRLPISCSEIEIQQNSESLTSFLDKEKLEILGISVDVVSAERFNHLLSKGFNKSQCCQQILSPLLIKSHSDRSRITVDRQGGRRYYGEWLIETFPKTPLSINRETQNCSSYNLGSSLMQFQVKGDDKYLETALASIFSKYIRELMMICFNSYWNKMTPGIKRTAGYPQDGKRFIKELDCLGVEYNKEKLIRQK